MPLDTQAAPSKASVLSQDRGSEENKLDRKGGTAAGAKRKYRRHPKVRTLASLLKNDDRKMWIVLSHVIQADEVSF